MADQVVNDLIPEWEEVNKWEAPEILERGRIEALLFSDEPDPWGP